MSINHPSYNPHAAGCVEDDVRKAIAASVANAGKITQLQWSETAARILAQECEWESESSYSYRGEDCDGNTWRVTLLEEG